MTREGGRAKPLGKKAKRGAAWAFIRESGSEILLFPASMALARLLSPEEFGIAAAAGFFTLLAGRLSGLGLNAALIRIKELRPEHLSTVFVVNLTFGLLAFVALTVSAPLVGRFYDVPETGEILPIAALGFLIAPFGTVPAASLTRDMRFRETTLADWYHLVAFSGTALVLAWLGFSYMSMVYARLAGLVTLTVSRVLYARWRPSLAFSMTAFREVAPFGAGVQAKGLLDYTAKNVDNLLVGKLYGMATLGLYDKAFSTMERVLARLNTGGPGMTFRIFAIIQEEPERFRLAYHKVVMSTTLLTFPVFGVLAAVAPQFMVVLFGDQWRASALPFQILCLAGSLKLLNTYASSASQAAGRIWSEVWRQVLYVAVIVTALVLLQRWGPAGAALGVLLATVVMTVLMHGLLMRATPLGVLDIARPLIPALLCAAGAVTSVLIVEYALRGAGVTVPAWLLLGLQGAAAGLFTGAFVLFAPHTGLRRLVQEVGEDLIPAPIRRHRWVRLYLDAAAGQAEVSR